MRRFVITEDAERAFMESVLCEAFYPTCEKVLYIKEYLDNNFARQDIDDIDSNGYPKKTASVMMLSVDKKPLKTLMMDEFLLHLDDKFHNMIGDDADRKKFLKQVVQDWYRGNISKEGMLSVNVI